MILPEPLYEALSTALREYAPAPADIRSITPVYGGDINQTYRLTTTSTDFFVKVNDDPSAFSMFTAEAAGLDLLRSAASGVHVPSVLTIGQAHQHAFLLMSWVSAGDKHRPDGQAALGHLLASLHRREERLFGLSHNNYIGRLPQRNTPSKDWSMFFIEQRLQPLLESAVPYLNGTDLHRRFEELFKTLKDRYPKEVPVLLHGDLWGGNYLIDATGNPILIDPAVYYGHREVDLAMTKLFGGFSEQFYAAYHEAYPLAPGWEKRTNLWNLYPLLVHLNLFGSSYIDPIRTALTLALRC